MGDEFAAIRDGLRRLREAPKPPDEFKPGYHRYRLAPPLTEDQVRAFEAAHGVALPAEYRRFLIEVGNGGAGPHYGVFPLGRKHKGFVAAPWEPGDGEIGVLLREPFPHTDEWNGIYSTDPLEDEDRDAYRVRMDALEEQYEDPAQVNGSIPLCEVGCGYFLRLIVAGPEVGNIWWDGRQEDMGLIPLTRQGSPRTTFLQWYQDWLDEALTKLDGGPSS